jgi:hypothetical protein
MINTFHVRAFAGHTVYIDLSINARIWTHTKFKHTGALMV